MLQQLIIEHHEHPEAQWRANIDKAALNDCRRKAMAKSLVQALMEGGYIKFEERESFGGVVLRASIIVEMG